MFRKVITFLWFTGCGLTPQVADDNTSSEQSKTSQEIDTSSGEATLSAKSGSSVSGVQATFPAGALAVATEVTIEEGSSIASVSNLNALGVDADSVDEAGPSVSITAADVQDAKEPFTLALPISSSGLGDQGARLNNTNLVVIFIVQKVEENDYFMGVIPESEFESSAASEVKIKTKYFGVYQTAYLPVKIETKVEVNGAVTSIPKKAEVSVLEGVWLGGCEDKTENDGSYRSVNEMLNVTGKNFVFEHREYTGKGCATPKEIYRVLGQATVGSDLAKPSGAKELDVIFSKMMMAPVTDKRVEELNQEQACGKTDWQKNVYIDVSSCEDDGDSSGTEEEKDCNDGPTIGKMVYEIFKVDGDKLYFSSEEACPALDKADRPKALDTSMYFEKR